MEKSNITIGKEAQQKYLAGIAAVSSVIRQSYGPKGGNVAIEEELYPFHRIVNDAQSIIQKIHIEDPVMRRGLNFVKELSDKATKDSGEGRKTTLIIAEEILKRGFETERGSMELKEELDESAAQVLDYLEKNSQRIEIEDVMKVAETSSRSQEIAYWLQKIYKEIGRDGIVEVEGSGMTQSFYETTKGVRFKDAGWISSYMSHGDDPNKAVYEKPTILITRKRLNNDSEIGPFLDTLIKSNRRDLVIVTDDMDAAIASRMIATHRAKVMNILVIRAPILFKDFIFEDFAKCVGADILSEASGTNYKNLVDQINRGLFRLGTCDRLVTDQEDTVLSGIQDISEHVSALKERGSNDDLIRLQWLNQATAVFKVGADSESELSYKLLKARDAVAACSLALRGGVVPGGGLTLALSAENIKSVILKEALFVPQAQLLENNGGVAMNVDGVNDSTIVLQNAVRNAVSLAGIVLTTKADIRIPDRSFEDKQLEILYHNKVKF